MSSLNTKQAFKGAFVSVPKSGANIVLPFQYNPSSMQRNLKPNMVGGEQQDRSMAVIFRSQPTQTISVSIELDASDALDKGDSNAEQNGVYAQLAALELLASPSTSDVQQMQSKLSSGILEVAPLEAPMIYFLWGPSRILPVRLTQYSVTEELFDGQLNPIRVTIATNMRVLNCFDVDSSNKAYQQYMAYQQKMEQIAPSAYGSMKDTGVNSI